MCERVVKGAPGLLCLYGVLADQREHELRDERLRPAIAHLLRHAIVTLLIAPPAFTQILPSPVAISPPYGMSVRVGVAEP